MAEFKLIKPPKKNASTVKRKIKEMKMKMMEIYHT
jgi:hypothetical protein